MSAALARSLVGILVDDFVPSSGQTFQMMTFGGRVGTFTDVIGPLTVAHNATDVTLSAGQGLIGTKGKKGKGQ